jgi:hypothetical protein
MRASNSALSFIFSGEADGLQEISSCNVQPPWKDTENL